MHAFSFKNFRDSYRTRYEPEAYIRVARSIWTIVLISACGVLVSCLLFDAWHFFAPPHVPATEAKGGGITSFNRAQLSSTVDFYKKRQESFQAMMSGE